MELGKFLIGLGIFLILAGIYLTKGGNFSWLGNLPGDFRWESQSGTAKVYFPMMTSILVSVAITILLYILRRFF